MAKRKTCQGYLDNFRKVTRSFGFENICCKALLLKCHVNAKLKSFSAANYTGTTSRAAHTRLLPGLTIVRVAEHLGQVLDIR